MTIQANQVTVGSTATLLCTVGNKLEHVRIRNDDATASIFIGPADVTTSTGYELPAGATASAEIFLNVEPFEKIYAVSIAGGVVAHVLRATRPDASSRRL